MNLFEVSELALWNVDLALTASKVNIDSTLNSLAVRSGVEDVANSLAVSKWGVRHLDFLVVALVSKGDEELTTGEGVEVVFDVSFN